MKVGFSFALGSQPLNPTSKSFNVTYVECLFEVHVLSLHFKVHVSKTSTVVLLHIPQLKIGEINMHDPFMSAAVDNDVATRFVCGPICTPTVSHTVCINLSSREDATPSNYKILLWTVFLHM